MMEIEVAMWGGDRFGSLRFPPKLSFLKQQADAMSLQEKMGMVVIVSRHDMVVSLTVDGHITCESIGEVSCAILLTLFENVNGSVVDLQQSRIFVWVAKPCDGFATCFLVSYQPESLLCYAASSWQLNCLVVTSLEPIGIPFPATTAVAPGILMASTPGNATSNPPGPQLIRRRRSQTAFGTPLHIGLSSAVHAPTHPQDPLSVIPKAKISPVEAAGDFYADAAEMARDNPSTEANPADDSKVPFEIVLEDVFLQYFGSVNVAPAPSFPVCIHQERVDESSVKGIPTSKEEFHSLRASLFRLSKETNDSPILATTYNDMDLSLNDLFSLHKMAKDSHDEAVAALQHLGSLRQEKKHIQTSFNEAEIKAITPSIGALESTIKAQDYFRSSLFRQRIHLDNKIWELADILMDLHSEGIAASVTQEVFPVAEQQPEDILAADTQVFLRSHQWWRLSLCLIQKWGFLKK
ncbi:hypothetical protein RND71_034590 [Anisodus tanguticus]|uniref:Uncharacterized protein n=1 Tax=Anisodus tanguticus TaxID=243964 RepID=A0AAE1V2R8_9SOLA|nr:hypothetical protein RND71_034590 [Anisodus tanguticus]